MNRKNTGLDLILRSFDRESGLEHVLGRLEEKKIVDLKPKFRPEFVSKVWPWLC